MRLLAAPWESGLRSHGLPQARPSLHQRTFVSGCGNGCGDSFIFLIKRIFRKTEVLRSEAALSTDFTRPPDVW